MVIPLDPEQAKHARPRSSRQAVRLNTNVWHLLPEIPREEAWFTVVHEASVEIGPGVLSGCGSNEPPRSHIVYPSRRSQRCEARLKYHPNCPHPDDPPRPLAGRANERQLPREGE
jgi:hypothetical protein